MRTPILSRSFIVALSLLFSVQFLAAQDNGKLDDSTTLFGRFTGVVSKGTVIKTSSNRFYEITEKINQKVNLNQAAEIKVYKDGKKYKISIQGIEKVMACNKLQEVIESNIDGDFKGWDGNTTFELVNKQKWQQDAPTPTIFANLYRPAVTIYLTSEGYKMKIAGLNEDPILVKKIN